MTDAAITERTGSGVGADAPASRVSDFVQLLKPRVMTLVVFTGVVGLLIAPGTLHPVLAAVAVLCIAVGSGAAGAVNMWYDRDIDSVMARTAERPIPTGRVEPGDAPVFSGGLAMFSLVALGLATTRCVPALLAGASLVEH